MAESGDNPFHLTSNLKLTSVPLEMSKFGVPSLLSFILRLKNLFDGLLLRLFQIYPSGFSQVEGLWVEWLRFALASEKIPICRNCRPITYHLFQGLISKVVFDQQLTVDGTD
jgi:hypothetical protein